MPMAADGGTPVAPRLWSSASWAVWSCQKQSRLVPRASANRRERSVGRSVGRKRNTTREGVGSMRQGSTKHHQAKGNFRCPITMPLLGRQGAG